MDSYHLPHAPLPAGSLAAPEVIIRQYVTRQSTAKNKIVLHQHMLSLLLDGHKTIAQASGTATVHQDELVLLAAGHCLTTEALSGAGQFRSIILYFSPQVLADFYARHAALIRQFSAGGAGPAAASQSLVVFPKDAFLRNYGESLRLLLHAGAPLPPAIRQLKLEELLLYLFQTAPASMGAFGPAPAGEPADMQLRRVVESTSNQLLTVKELAFLCHMSASTFQRKFAARYGLPPQKWLLRQRLLRAADLLRHHDQPPGEVYQQVGYESHSSFSEAFRKLFGTSPTAFRQAAQHPPKPGIAPANMTG